MGLAGLLLLGLWATTALAYLPPIKEHFLPEALLREVMELEGYLEDTAYPQLRSGDYQENPSVRDHEYLQHSSLWANPFISENNENNNIAGIQRPENKQDTLPAYCDPPNPCPNGYTAEEGCIEEFENTASFSREYQARQDCMCDSEHMFDCAASGNNNEISESDFDRLVQQFHADEGHKVLVAKKYHMKKYLQTAQKPPKSKWSSPPMHVNEEAESWEVPQAPPLEKLANARTSTVTYLKQSVNPYLEGERLPVAAKKGIHIAH